MTRRIILVAGPLAFVSTLLTTAPESLGTPGWRVLGFAVWMALWWLTAIVPLEATALLPIVVLPLITKVTVGSVTASFADPVIFLFLGGFFLAATLERWKLDRRFALRVVGLVGVGQSRVLLAIMVATALVSMWLSNTATAMMMLPIARAVVSESLNAPAESPALGVKSGFATALMLGVAYASSIGGVGTLVGTPPNAIFAASSRELAGVDVSFLGWMKLGVPLMILMLAGCWLLLTRLHRVSGDVPGLDALVQRERAAQGALGGSERFVLTVFVLTALAWIFREPKPLGALRIPGLTDVIPGVTDAGIAIAAAVVLFVLPLGSRARFPAALDWESARKVPWGVLLIFGGGIALASGFDASGLTNWVGRGLESMRGVPLPLALLVTSTLFVFLTELTSNTATAALAMPLMAGVAAGLGLPPLPLMAAAALAASMGFMLPVGTPPNAIAFSTGVIAPRQMARAGLWLDLMSIVAVTVGVWIWAG